MIEVRTYDGTAGELAEFNRGVWARSYGGKKTVALWDEAYFDWQLFSPRPEGRDYLLAAYEGPTLVGSLLSEAFPFRIHGEHVNATIGGWLSVHPDHRRKGIGSKLLAELRRRHQLRGEPFQIGYGYVGALGPKFWKQSPDTESLTRLGLWARVLDHEAVARWDLNPLDRVGTRLLGLFQRRLRPPKQPRVVRPYRADDLPACLRLAQRFLDGVDLGVIWEQDRLSRQLDYRGFPRTLVTEHEGDVGGFVNYHPLVLEARGQLKAGIIDLVALGDLPHAACVTLLRAMMQQMSSEGIQLALLLRTPCFAARPLVSTGFVIRPREFHLLCVRMQPNFSPGKVKRVHVLWR